MRYLIYFFAVSVLLIIQMGLFPSLELAQIGSLILVFMVIVTLLSPFNDGLYVAIAGGLLLDMASETVDGTMVASLTLTFLAVYLVINKVLTREPNRLILLSSTTGATIMYSSLVVGLSWILHFAHLSQTLDWKYILGRKLLLDIIGNLVFVYPLYVWYRILLKLEKRLNK